MWFYQTSKVGTAVGITQPNNGIFKITAAKTGNAKVCLKVFLGESTEEALSIEFSCTVKDTRPPAPPAPPENTTGIPSDFFTAEKWTDVADETAAGPTVSENGISFDGIAKVYQNLFDSKIVKNSANGQSYSYKFRLKTSNTGDFKFRICAGNEIKSTDNKTGNQISFTCSGGSFYIYSSVGNNEGAKYEASVGSVGYVSTNWHDFEIILTAARRSDIKHEKGASTQTDDRGCIGVELKINGKRVEFKLDNNTTSSVQNNDSNRASKIENSIFYVNRLPEVSGIRYGQNLMVKAASGTVVTLAPVSSN